MPHIPDVRLTLDEIAAAAEMILAQEEESSHKEEEWQDSSDEGMSEESECEGVDECDLGDSGYGEGASPAMDTR